MSTTAVVVGVDESPLSDAAIVWGAARAAAQDIQLRLVHASFADVKKHGAFNEDKQGIRMALSDEAHRLLARAEGEARALTPDLNVATVAHRGFASKALLSEAGAHTVIVLGFAGAGVMGRPSLGPVTLQVLTHAHCPVVITGRDVSPTPVHQKVIAAVDGSPASWGALEQAIDHAEVTGAEVEVLECRAEGDDVARQVEEHRRPGVAMTYVALDEDPAAALMERSAEADLLALGTRSSAEPGAHIGDVTGALVGRAGCPVIVAPKPRLRAARP